MPGWAGSSWYWMRYMDAHNENEFASKEALRLLAKCRFIHWRKRTRNRAFIVLPFLEQIFKDKGFAPTEEPFKKLINQGMILGMSAFVYRVIPNYELESSLFTKELKKPLYCFEHLL